LAAKQSVGATLGMAKVGQISPNYEGQQQRTTAPGVK